MIASTKRPTEAWRSANLFELGLGQVVVSRFKLSGEVEAGVFLVDVFCRGVKDAFFTKLWEAEYESRLLGRVFADGGKEALSPACARRLVEGAVEYAQHLGFLPHADYRQGCRVFGGIDAAVCECAFAYGRNGRPCFLQSSTDSPDVVRRAMANLRARCGEGNFDYLLVSGPLV